MKYLTIISLAGLLIACAPNTRIAQPPTGCNSPVCFVQVTVADDQITATPDPLEVESKQVIIRFRLPTPGYEFATDAGKAIEFKDKVKAAKQFSQAFRGGPKLIVMFDLHGDEKETSYKYTIRVIPSGGGDTIELDPMIINR